MAAETPLQPGPLSPGMVKRWFRRLFPERPCDCDACTGRTANRSRSINVSHGLHMWVEDGQMHYRAKSRIVDQ